MTTHVTSFSCKYLYTNSITIQ